MRSRLSVRLGVSISIGLASLAGDAGAAIAQRGEVFVDPDSPAGKEYALPLETARRNATGGGGRAAHSRGSPALFGAGISHRRSVHDEVRSRNGGGSPADKPPSDDIPGGGSQSGDDDGNGRSAAVARAIADSGGGPSAGVLTTLVALGVLVVGGAAGLLLRSTRRQ